MLSVEFLEENPGTDPTRSQKRFKVGTGVPPGGPTSTDMFMSSLYQGVDQWLLTSPEQERIY